MRSVHELFLRAVALSVAALGAAALVGPACSLFSQSDDCKSACTNLNQCGQLHTSDCGLYCTGQIYSAGLAGCGSQFDDLNACAKANTNCSTAQSACSTQTTAFTKCMESYCSTNPTGNGCPGGGDGGAGDGGKGDGG
jgi:hypothetical protein